jgi:hypothetical protein
MQQFADFMVNTVNCPAGATGGAAHGALTPTMAMAAVGGIHELVLQAIERGEAGSLQAMTPSASEMVRLLTQADLSGR